jgi:hypothetical protein
MKQQFHGITRGILRNTSFSLHVRNGLHKLQYLFLASHSIFKLCNTSLLSPFVSYEEKIVANMVSGTLVGQDKRMGTHLLR